MREEAIPSLERWQVVRITDGPFMDFCGFVDKVNFEEGKVKVIVAFFDRETAVWVDFLQIEGLPYYVKPDA